MRKWLNEFLFLLEQAYPPPAGAHHAITGGQYGSDETGWTVVLTLQMNRHLEGKGFHTFLFDDADFEGTPEALVAQIITKMKEWDATH